MVDRQDDRDTGAHVDRTTEKQEDRWICRHVKYMGTGRQVNGKTEWLEYMEAVR